MSSLQVEFLLNSHCFQYYDQNTICANAKKVELFNDARALPVLNKGLL